MDAKQKWDRIHAKSDTSLQPEPCYALTTYQHLVSQTGRALDLACGLGGNAFALADRGYKTTALDISSVAIERINQRQHALISARCEPADAGALCAATFDIIVVSNFLDRSLCPAITAALKPGGVLFYQTFVQDKADTSAGPSNPDYLLERNELLLLFKDLEVLAFSDQGCHGDTGKGLRNQSFLVATRRNKNAGC